MCTATSWSPPTCQSSKTRVLQACLGHAPEAGCALEPRGIRSQDRVAEPHRCPQSTGETMKILNDFKAFLMQGNLITLAIAFVMGVAFAAVVTSLVGDLVMPIIGAIFGKT